MDTMYVPIQLYKPYQSEDMRTLVLSNLCDEFGLDNVLAAMNKRCNALAQRNQKICLSDQELLRKTGGFVDATEGNLTNEMIANYAMDIIDAALDVPDLAPQVINVMKNDFGIDNVRSQPRSKLFGLICIALLLSCALFISMPSSQDQKTMTVTNTDDLTRALWSAYKNQDHRLAFNANGQQVLTVPSKQNEVAIWETKLQPQVLVIEPEARAIFNEIKLLDSSGTEASKDLMTLYKRRFQEDKKKGRIYAFAAHVWDGLKKETAQLAANAGNDINEILVSITRRSYELVIDAKDTSERLIKASIDDLNDPEYVTANAVFNKQYNIFLDVLSNTAWTIFSEQASEISDIVIEKTTDFNLIATEAVKSAYIYLQSSIDEVKQVINNGPPTQPLRSSPRTYAVTYNSNQTLEPLLTTTQVNPAVPTTTRKRTRSDDDQMPQTPAPSTTFTKKRQTTSTRTRPTRSLMVPTSTTTSTTPSPSTTVTKTFTSTSTTPSPSTTLTKTSTSTTPSPSTTVTKTSTSTSTTPSPSTTLTKTSTSTSPSTTQIVIPDASIFTTLDRVIAEETLIAEPEPKSSKQAFLELYKRMEVFLRNPLA